MSSARTELPVLTPDVLPTARGIVEGTGNTPGKLAYVSGPRTADPTPDLAQSDQSTPRKPAQRRKTSSPSQRYALSEHFKDALENARTMEEAASDGNHFDLATAGVSLVDNLAKLWDLRHLRGDDWISIVNFLQTMITRIEFETLTHEQCTALRLVIESHLAPDVDAGDVQASIALLLKAGFNTWRAISEE